MPPLFSFCKRTCNLVRPGSLKAARLVICSTPLDIKNVEPVLSPVPRVEAFACPVCRNEQRRKPHAECYSNHPYGYTDGCLATRVYTQYGLSINIPRGVFVALFLTNCLKLRSSNTSKPRRPENAYVHDVRPHPIRQPESQHLRGNICKSTKIIL